MSIVRVRQHVNPLSDKYQRVVDSPDWDKAYADLSLPLHLDIGCGRGVFLLTMAQQQLGWNYLGLEIREPLVVEALARQQALGLTNLHYIFCNANLSLRSLLASLPTESLQCVSIQFPDPWFKKRHQKRRVVQPALVEAIAAYLAPGGKVFLQSDVEAVEREMCDRFAEHPAFVRQEAAWLTENPLPISTEREQFTLAKGEPVYRAVFLKELTRCATPPNPLALNPSPRAGEGFRAILAPLLPEREKGLPEREKGLGDVACSPQGG